MLAIVPLLMELDGLWAVLVRFGRGEVIGDWSSASGGGVDMAIVEEENGRDARDAMGDAT